MTSLSPIVLLIFKLFYSLGDIAPLLYRDFLKFIEIELGDDVTFWNALYPRFVLRVSYTRYLYFITPPGLSRPLLREGLHSGARYQAAEKGRRIFEINSRPKINSHEEEPSRRCHPNRWLRRILWPEDKIFQPSFGPSLSFLGPIIPPGLSIPLSCFLILFLCSLSLPLLFSVRNRSYPYS